LVRAFEVVAEARGRDARDRDWESALRVMLARVALHTVDENTGEQEARKRGAMHGALEALAMRMGVKP
jgi:hypothetical protein